MPKIVDADEKRREILKAALQAARQQGVRATNLQQVAAQAGISKSSIYHYFSSREALVSELIADALACDLRCAAAADGETAWDSIVGLLSLAQQDLLRWAEVGPVLLDLLTDDAGRAVHQNVLQSLHYLLSRAIERAQREGSVREGPPEVLAAFVIDALEGNILRHAIAGTVPSPEEASHLRRFLLEGLQNSAPTGSAKG